MLLGSLGPSPDCQIPALAAEEIDLGSHHAVAVVSRVVARCFPPSHPLLPIAAHLTVGYCTVPAATPHREHSVGAISKPKGSDFVFETELGRPLYRPRRTCTAKLRERPFTNGSDDGVQNDSRCRVSGGGHGRHGKEGHI